MSDVNRDKFYEGSDDEWGDDSVEYEVEPPDPEVLAAEERRAQEMMAATQLSIDINAVYDEADESHDREYFDDLLRDFRLRFRTKHLLLATTVVAVVIAVTIQRHAGMIFVLGMLLVIGGATAYLSWKQHQREQELERRREELFTKRRLAQRLLRGRNSARPSAESPVEEAPQEEESEDMWSAEVEEDKKFRLRFSLRELMVAAVCVAVLIGLIVTWTLPITATAMGFIALGGLMLHAMGFEPPYEVAFAWWVLLLLYVLLSIVAAVVSGIG